MRLRKVVLLGFVLASASGHAATTALGVWESSTDPVTKERFIPVELWTGGEWDGKKELKMASASTRFGDRWHKEIRGPIEWKHPVTGETLLAYERTNPERGGVKLQLYAINEERTGLGRVYDSRRELGTRTFSGGLKFPLGYWKERETRKFVEKRYEGSRVESRVESITITQIDYTYQGIPHCLEFYWLYSDREGGKIIDHQTYTYCPHRGMVRAVQH